MVLLVFVPGLAFTASLVACFKAGLVGVPVYPPDPTRFGKELLHFTTTQKDCGAQVVLTHATYGFAKTLGDLKGFFSFGKKECEWPSLKWVQVDAVLKVGKSTVPVVRRYPQAGLAFLQYTSGSTSAPKGVMVTAQNLVANFRYMAQAGVAQDIVTASWLPQYHDMGLIGTYLMTLYFGGSGYYMSPMGFLKDPLSWIRLIALSRATLTAGPNFAFGLVLRKLRDAKPGVADAIRKLDLSCLRYLTNGAEPINAKVLQEFLMHFAPQGLDPNSVNNCYGLAEHTLNAAGFGKGLLLVDKIALEAGKVVVVRELELTKPYVEIDGTVALVSCGRTDFPGVSASVADPDTCTALPADHVGELWVSSDSKAKGYYNRPELSQETFHARLDGSSNPEHGHLEWLRTGDLAFIYKNEVYFCGRIKDLIIINGLNYYPQDVERTAEACHDALRPGCSAAFAIKQESDLSEGAVLVAEVRVSIHTTLLVIDFDTYIVGSGYFFSS
jgi:acyl-CoA synthetase (AMP-forming)/AMP-acid ligase II